ncbi:MAG TPA: aryl-sulfate sulfotransferase [Steroidobacteraceae bacterium]
MTLSACGGGGSSGTAALNAPAAQTSLPQAQASSNAIVLEKAGVTPFIGIVTMYVSGLANLLGVEFTIEPEAGAVSKPVNVWYSLQALTARGFVDSTGTFLSLPVFGLYADHANQVSVQLQFQDRSAATLALEIDTPTYSDPTGIYDKPLIRQPRLPGSSLGFNYFYMKSGLGSPVIVDTDGQIRWVVPGIANAISSIFQGDGFVIGDPAQPFLYRVSLDGAQTSASLSVPDYTEFHHNIDPGNLGFFAEVNTAQAIESNVIEIDEAGDVLNHWDLGKIISDYMTSQGDNAAAFVRPGVDWFHNNATTYDPSDNSVIVSSRENFVIKIDYHTGNIIWILGDPAKYWYTFPSLRAKALTLAAGGFYPIGQHGISIISGGLLMLFNDGLASSNQPAGEPAGDNRSYSTVSAYSIDIPSMTATEVWDFDYGQTILSQICSSAYEAPGGSILVDYAVADGFKHARLVGLDPSRTVVFDFQYDTVPCNTSWNAKPIALDNLTISD